MPNSKMNRRLFAQTAGLGVAAALTHEGASAQDNPARAPVVEGEDELLAEVVKKHTGHDATSVERLTWFDVYGDSDALYFSVRCEEREYIVRVPQQPRTWAAEGVDGAPDYHAVIGRWVLDELRARGLPAPRVYAVDRDCDILDRPVAITSRLAGRPWRYYEEVRKAEPQTPLPATGEEVGRYVRGMHDIAVADGFGAITDEGAGLADSWAGFLWQRRQANVALARTRGNLSDDECALVSAVIDKWASECDLDQGRVLWMDDIMFGLLVDARKRTVTGVAHATNAMSGDADWELEWFAYYAEDTDAFVTPPEEFAEGYGRRYDERAEKRSFYRMGVYLAKLSWLPPDGERAGDHQRKAMDIARRLA